MEIRFYTPELNLIGIMENQTSLLWTRKFYEPGSFQLITPITPYNVKLCKLRNIITIDGADEAAVIECVTLRQEHSRRIITCVGRFLDSYLDRRLIRPSSITSDNPTYSYVGTIEGAMRDVFSNMTVPLPIELGTNNNFPGTVEFDATYKNVLVYMEKLSRAGNIGFKVTPDFTNKTLTFDTYMGKDHSVHQSERIRVIFSEYFENISTIKYQLDERMYKNVFYIGGSGTGVARKYSLLGVDEIYGLDRREHFVSSDINDDLTQYIYNPPTFNLEEPTEKLTNVPIYEEDRSSPIYEGEKWQMRDSGGRALYEGNDGNLYSSSNSSSQDASSLVYQRKYATEQDGRMYAYYEDSGGNKKTTYNGGGITIENFYNNGTARVVGYRQKLVGTREETDAEFAARKAAYRAELERYNERLAQYEKDYKRRLTEYQLRVDSIYMKNGIIENFEVVVNPNGNFKYRTDYDLGDIITVNKESWELNKDMRITEIQEIYEHGLAMIEVTLGDTLPETIDWEDK